MQLGICKVTVEYNNKCKMCSFFLGPGNRQTLLGMPDTELLNILTISCNTIGTEKEGKDANCITNIVPMMQDVNSTMQTQDQDGAVQEQTATCSAIQTQAEIQI